MALAINHKPHFLQLNTKNSSKETC